jgi:transposase-like protein
MNNEMIKCPRCDNSNLIDYGNIIECPRCNLEFHKKDLLNLKQDEILAISEKMTFIKSLKNKHPE